LDRLGPTEGRRCHQQRPRRRGRGRTGNQRKQFRVSLDLDWLRQTGGDPGVRPSHQAPTGAPNPRVRVLEQPPSPSPDPLTYRPMEPLDLTDSPWGRQEPSCAIHGTGPCPYPVTQWQPVSSSPGRGGGEEEVTAEEEEENDMVAVTVVDKDDELVEVIPVPESTPPRSPYKQTARIRIGPRGRPTGTLAPREGAREPMTRDLFTARYADCIFNEDRFSALGGEFQKIN
jgi:hypothetical protein